MSSDSFIRTTVFQAAFMMLLSCFTLAQPPPEQSGKAAGRSPTIACRCRLVVNYNMQTGRPCINIVNTSESPHPVVCEADVKNDTTLYIRLYLPYTWPDRGRTLPDTCFPARSFHLHLVTDTDSAHYFVEFEQSTERVQPVAIKPAGFVDIVQPKAYPVNTVMFQIVSRDHQLAEELLQALRASGEGCVLEPGYYYGVPREIRAATLGRKQFNETVDGILLAVRFHGPLSEANYTAIRSLVDAYDLTWYYPPPVDGP